VNRPHSRLEQANQRLAQAIGRLEGALEAKGKRTDNLAPDLSRLQAENVVLKGLMGQASTRLDATIVQLKAQMVEES